MYNLRLYRSISSPVCCACERLSSLWRPSAAIHPAEQQPRVADHIRYSAQISTGADVSSSTMAAQILQKKHRFILVSDLDWTMVRSAFSHARHCQQDSCLPCSRTATHSFGMAPA
jgi:hypothetical protein